MKRRSCRAILHVKCGVFPDPRSCRISSGFTFPDRFRNLSNNIYCYPHLPWQALSRGGLFIFFNWKGIHKNKPQRKTEYKRVIDPKKSNILVWWWNGDCNFMKNVLLFIFMVLAVADNFKLEFKCKKKNCYDFAMKSR